MEGVTPGRPQGLLVREEGPPHLAEYATVPISFTVKNRLRIDAVDGGLGGFILTTEPVEKPYVKDYDSARGEGPTRWAKRWDISRWGVIAAFDGGRRVGGAAVAWNTPGVHMLV